MKYKRGKDVRKIEGCSEEERCSEKEKM